MGKISSYGRIQNRFGVVYMPATDNSGYSFVRINDVLYRIHQLVAVAFNLPRKDYQTTVDHIRGLKIDYPNQVSNLRYASYKEQRVNQGVYKSRLSGKMMKESYTLPDEEWHSLPEPFNLYYISNMGRMRNIKSPNVSYTPAMHHSGYVKVHLKSSDKEYQPYMERLVALLFVQKPDGWDESWQVNHINMAESNET